MLGGAEAIDRFESRLPEIAANYDMTPARLRDLLETDPYLRIDPDGALLYVDPVHDHDGFDEHPDNIPPIAHAETDAFALNSKPGSQRTILLDFNGHVVTNTAWNGPNVPQGYFALPYDSDGNPGSFSTTERTFIRAVWARVAEDFAPFDVNVTTQDPGFDAINRSSSGDQVYGTRLVVSNSPSSDFCGGCGGIAYLGNFDRTNNHANYQPAWCFSSSGSSAKSIAECASHEIGHNLGLGHDGVSGGSDYYSGHTPWAPIMGVGYNQPVSQWSKGEYTNASNTQDDLVVMQGRGISLRPDDHGNSTGTATPFAGLADGMITSASDVDYFRWLAGGTGTVTFHAAPSDVGPNLDIRLSLYSSSGNLLTEANPTVSRVNAGTANGLSATINYPVSAGELYFLRVTGTGHQTGATGYTDYASIGPYTLTSSGVPAGFKMDSVGLADRNTGLWYLRDSMTGKTTSFYYGVPGDIPFMGDWDGDGVATPGLYRQSTGFVYIRDSNSQGPANRTFHFGIPGDIPIVGDFNGSGRDTVSVYRPSTGQVYIINTLPPEGGSPVAELSYYFGQPGDKPFAGDFNGDGIDTIGLHRESTGLVYFRNTHSQGFAHAEFFYGTPGDFIIAGKWVPGTVTDTVGIFRPSNAWFYLRHSNSQGNADHSFPYGKSGMRPVYGFFGNLPGASTPPPGN